MSRKSLKTVCRLIDEVNKEIPVEKSFLADLERSMELDAEKNSRKPSQTYKPSSMKCLRAMYYMVTGKEPDTGSSNYQLIGICNSGTDTHERIQYAISMMHENNIDCAYCDVATYIKSRNLDNIEVREKNGFETKLYHKDLNMSFMVDGIVRYKGHYYILELKTENLSKWGSRKSVNREHYNQATAYSLSLGIDEVIFIYICRDNSAMKSFMFKVTNEMKHELVAQIDRCNDYVGRKEIPPKLDSENKHPCMYCSYKKSCSKEG